MALIDACYTFFLKRPEVWADNCSAPNYICVRSYLTLEEKQPGMYLSAAGFAGCWSCVFTVTARLIVLGLNGLQYVFENYMKKGRGLQSSFDCSDCTDGCLGSLICKMFPINFCLLLHWLNSCFNWNKTREKNYLGFSAAQPFFF